MSGYQFQTPVGDLVSGDVVEIVFITSVPAQTQVDFSPALPNEPLYPRGVGRARWLYGSGATFFASPWMILTGNLNSFKRPAVAPGMQVFFNFQVDPGVAATPQTLVIP